MVYAAKCKTTVALFVNPGVLLCKLKQVMVVKYNANFNHSLGTVHLIAILLEKVTSSSTTAKIYFQLKLL